MAIKSLCHIHKYKELYQTLNHEIAHHNNQGETSATAMGKLGNFAYNIGTSLNANDINTHRQTITPTAKTLQNLSPEEQLVIKQDNQALLNANEVQRAWEVESGDGFEDKTIAGQIAQNKYKYCATQGVSRENCYSYIRQQNLDNLGTAAEDFAVLASVYRGGGIKPTKTKAQPKQSATTQTKAACTTGTLIETSEGLKPIETIEHGDLV